MIIAVSKARYQDLRDLECSSKMGFADKYKEISARNEIKMSRFNF